MLCERIENTGVEVAPAAAWAPELASNAMPDWRVIDRKLRVIRRSRAALDAEEMHWLREAEAVQIWRPLGMVSALDYLERVLGYAPRTAQERMRVARALGTLPHLTAALAEDQLSFSAVRELTRVATPATEAAWISAAAGKNLREIEALVADHRPGDGPDDPPDPQARTHVVRFELAAETFALLRQARQVLDEEHATNLTDDQLVAALCNAVLDGTPAAEPIGRSKFQIAVTVCQHCRRGWQEGAGAQIAIDPEAVDRAMCDAQHVGSIDGPGPVRAHQDIPPSVARFVWRRDGGRCRVPGCRSARGLELHHLVHRADGGGHDPLNLALLCSACHLSHDRGALMITGTADHLEVRRPGEAASGMAIHPSQPRADTGVRDAHAMRAMIAVETPGADVSVPDHAISLAGSAAQKPVTSRAHVGALDHVALTARSAIDELATRRAHVGAPESVLPAVRSCPDLARAPVSNGRGYSTVVASMSSTEGMKPDGLARSRRQRIE